MSQLVKIVSSNLVLVKPAVPGEEPTPGSAGTPGTAAQPGHPAYCVKEFAYQQEIVAIHCEHGGPPPGGGSIHGGGDINCVQVHVGWVNVYNEVCYPATEGTPGIPGTAPVDAKPGTPDQDAQTIIIEDRHVGWTGSAISVAQFGATDNVKLTFRFRGVSAVVGFNDADEGSAYHEIDHGFYLFSAGQFYIMESGLTQFDSVGNPIYGAVNDHDPQYAIIRFNGQVMYYVWIIDHWSRVYTSTKRSEAPIFVDCSIYMGGDLIG